ncbi:uncharacterized protein LOC134290914 [Aedes albopictus]|uniref:Integrase catalytic domain-containing protein n=1 Tax=Aedes albopictus TaxID=7160 RepID=A0ABM1YFQ6_AEDAL
MATSDYEDPFAPATPNTKECKRLIIRRNSILGSAKLIGAFNEKYNPATDYAQIKFRLAKLDTLWTEFNEVQAEIELEYGLTEELSDGKATFEDMYYRLKGSLDSKLTLNNTPSTSTGHIPPPVAPPTQALGVRLPKLKIPEFKGDFDEWMNFHDLFNTLIHSNHQLSEVQKFQYLKAVLKGDALRLVQSLAVTATNYDIAWDLLKKRFDNKNFLIKQHFSALLSMAPVKKESSSALSDLADVFEKHIGVLDKLEGPDDHWNSFLVEFLSSKLDSASQKEWENQLPDNQRPTYKDLVAFIHRRSRVLQSLMLSQSSHTTSKPEPRSPRVHVSSHSALTTESSKACIACHKGSHFLSSCAEFLKLSPKQRFNVAKKYGLCLNCLRSSHLVKDCPSGNCRTCNKRHHTLLHINASTTLAVLVDSQSNPPPQPQHASQSVPVVESSSSVRACTANQSRVVSREMRPGSSPSGGQTKSFASPPSVTSSGSVHGSSPVTSCSAVTPSSTFAQRMNSTIFMLTAYVRVRDIDGNYSLARALLDSASERNFVTENLAQRLRLKREKSDVDVYGIGNSVQHVSQSVSVNLSSRVGSFSASIDFLVLPSLTRILPSTNVDISSWIIPRNLPLADPKFNVPHGIDMIIGIQWFFTLLEDDQISLGPQLPILRKTVFGYAVAGDHATTEPIKTVVCNAALTIDKLTAAVQRFWEVQSFEEGKALSLEEQYCEDHFRSTHSRAPDGRYVVRLPIRDKMLSELGESLPVAHRRFQAMERKFLTNTRLRSDYSQFMEEYESLGHMEVVEPDLSTPHFFLPHHAIIRPDSTTTKTRVVFDGSCRSANNLSLNDICYVGPTVQPPLLATSMNFRMTKYVITADAEKMYRQIWVHDSDRALQQIVWRKYQSQELRAYQLNTVTYGTACAPFLATRVLNQLADDEKEKFPLAATLVVKRSFYVDDCLAGDDDKHRMMDSCDQLIGLLASGGFVLRKWSSNDPEILSRIPENLRDNRDDLEIDKSCSVKTLGLLWHPQIDCFGFKVPKLSSSEPVTKRIALSEMSRLFDPMGLVGSVIVSAKIFLQSLWSNSFTWDSVLPQEYQDWWKSCGKSACNLLISKSRVSPLTRQSTPRLELCAAVMAAQLADSVKTSTELSCSTTFWSDSSIVLHWIASSSSSWKVYVSNRIAEIHRLTRGSEWRHVPSEANPADRVSRGVPASLVVNDQIWWHGPPFLAVERNHWPENIIELSPLHLRAREEEVRQTVSLVTTSLPMAISLINKHSTLLPLTHTFAWIRRFVSNSRLTAPNRVVGSLTTKEVDDSLRWLIGQVQEECFSAEIRFLQQNPGPVKKNFSFKSPLKKLNPFLDSEGLLRVHGRLELLEAPFDTRYPIILPAKHHLTNLIVTKTHIDTLHSGPQQLLSTLQQRFWVIRGRDAAKRVVNKCMVCFHCRPKPIEQLMGPLPAARVTPSRAFVKSGVDYCGPFFIRPPNRRGNSVKIFVAIVVCMASKAVHIEMVYSLSSDSFVSALKRFVSRRGRVSDVYCDNARTFVGANRQLQEHKQQFDAIHRSTGLAESCSEAGINFHFNPARSPHFGGLWEAAVKIFKHHLYRIMKTTLLTIEEFQTLITQIEGIMNSRPLTPLSSDPADVVALTPGHFLVGEPLHSVPEPDLSDIPVNCLNSFQHMQQKVQHFWRVWSRDYIGQLQSRQRWPLVQPDIKVGTMVLLKKEAAPPMKWFLGRIEAVFPGNDGHVQVVQVRTSTGCYRRAITEVCPLPIESDAEANEAPDAPSSSGAPPAATPYG